MAQTDKTQVDGHVGGVSGCTILGNGDICLILDIGTLLTLSEDKV